VKFAPLSPSANFAGEEFVRLAMDSGQKTRQDIMKRIVIKNRENLGDDIEFWKKKTPEERLNAVELLREQFYIIQGHKTIPRLIRELRLIDR